MSFVWDEEKEKRNVAKHKIPFAEAITIFDDPLFVIARKATAKERKNYEEEINSEMDDDLRPEYDFSKMRIVARGPKRKVPKAKVIHLDPDVARAFPDDATVNETLRLLMRVAKNQIDDNLSKRHAG